ncbi:hypothetical protein H0H93_002565 [Arthromyces matolae]|nr:hypothetical protein H0H93_002565 [Arthromyces matolae]
MPSNSTLFLSKSGGWGPQDYTAVASFMDCLNSATNFDDLLVFLAKRNASKVNGRIKKLCIQLQIKLDRLKERARWWGLSDVLSDAFAVLTNYVDPNEAPLLFDNEPESRAKFAKLALAANSFLRPTFESCIFWGYRGIIEDLELLLHRLEKVAQYLGGKALLQFWKKHGDTIRVIWVPGGGPLPPIALETTASGGRHIDALLAKRPYSPDCKRTLREDLDRGLYYHYNPGIVEYNLDLLTKPASIPMTVRVHPELQLLLWVTVNVFASKGFPGEQLYIGCSKATCLCCGLWINAFNVEMKMNWTTSIGKGHPRPDWAVPDFEESASTSLRKAVHLASEEAMKGVESRLEVLLGKEIDEALEDSFY